MSKRLQLSRRALFGILLLLVGAVSITVFAQQPAPQKGDTLTGKVIGVTDGDTLTLLVDKIKYKIRLEGIDAPENGQSFSAKARHALTTKVFEKQVRVEVTGQDKYGRTLGWVYLDDVNVNEWLVSHGWAWQFKEYNQDERLATMEAEAREAKAGLWAEENALPPWEYRARQKLPAPVAGPAKPKIPETTKLPTPSASPAPAPKVDTPKPAATAKFWLNTKSNVRHNPRCQYYNNTKAGRFCGPNEGSACGKCGG